MPVPASINAIFGEPARLARAERIARRFRIIALFGRDVHANAHKLRQPRARFTCIDGYRTRLVRRHVVFPFGKPRHASYPASGPDCFSGSPIAPRTSAPHFHPAFASEDASGRKRSLRVGVRQFLQQRFPGAAQASAPAPPPFREQAIQARAPIPADSGCRVVRAARRQRVPAHRKAARPAASSIGPTTNPACATSTSPERNRRRASSKPSLRVSPCCAAHAAAGGGHQRGQVDPEGKERASWDFTYPPARQGQKARENLSREVGIKIGKRHPHPQMFAHHHLGGIAQARGHRRFRVPSWRSRAPPPSSPQAQARLPHPRYPAPRARLRSSWNPRSPWSARRKVLRRSSHRNAGFRAAS